LPFPENQFKLILEVITDILVGLIHRKRGVFDIGTELSLSFHPSDVYSDFKRVGVAHNVITPIIIIKVVAGYGLNNP
jgi:hypothetical protein